MKKFSKVAKVTVSNEPVAKDVAYTEEDVIKTYIMSLLNNFLRIRMEGPIDPILRGTVKITGKEQFTQLMYDLTQELSAKGKVKILETIKSQTRDWEVIDKNIDSLNENLQKLTESNKLKSHKKRIQFLLERYNEEMIISKANSSLSRMKNQTISLRAKAARELANTDTKNEKLLIQVAEIFENKLNNGNTSRL